MVRNMRSHPVDSTSLFASASTRPLISKIQSMNRSFSGAVLALCCFVSIVLQVFCANGQPIINEIMYHPASTNLLEQWVELYNPGTNTVDLTDWKFSNGIQFTFPTNTVLKAGDYLVVAADRNTFTNKFPGVTNYVAGWAAPLEGHTIALDDNLGQNVN